MNIDFARCEFGKDEVDAVNRVLTGYWLANGQENEFFQDEFSRIVGSKHSIAVNSGSSGLLLSLKSLNLPKDSVVLTSACGFPATLSPILHCGHRPLLIDYDIETHNIDLKKLKKAVDENDVKAVIVAHTMGNPVDMRALMNICRPKGIKVIEDCCEAVGSLFNSDHVGVFGDFGCYSFYPSHQITALGTGGMVVTSNDEYANCIRSMRDWGKVCDWDSNLGDHKTDYEYGDLKYFKQYSYQTVGFNMKLSEAAAAFGRVQIRRLDEIREKRINNFEYLKNGLSDLDEYLLVPSEHTLSKPSWFGYVITLKSGAHNRNNLCRHLESKGIRTRPFFAGNITKHKPYSHLDGYFPVADKLMRDSMFIGCWQGIEKQDMDHMIDCIKKYFI